MNYLAYAVFVVSCGAACGACFMIGWHTGRERGRNEQWVEDFIAQGRKDAEKRDAHGRFRHIPKQHSTPTDHA